MIIQSLYDYFIDCPLTKNNIINVDYLGIKPLEYTIDSIPVEPIVTQYADGGALKQYVFVFASRELYGEDILNNIANSGFYQHFSEWVEEQSDNGNLPVLTGGKVAQSLEATTQGYAMETNIDSARYQIQMRLTYYEDK